MRARLCVFSLLLALLLAYSMGLAVLLMWTQGAFSPSRRWANKDAAAAAAVAGAAFLLDPCEDANPRRSNATAAWYRTQQRLARGWSPSASSSSSSSSPQAVAAAEARAGTALHPMPPPPSPRAKTEAAAPRARRHVYIHTTWRSGSSFVGELLNQHPAVFYMFEPLWHLWRAFPDRGALELQPKAIELLRDLFQCRLSRALSPLIRGRDDARLLFGWQRNKVMCSQALCPMPTTTTGTTTTNTSSSDSGSSSRHGAVPRSGGAACGRRCPRVSLRQLEEQCRRFGVVAVKDVRLLELHALRPLLLQEQDEGEDEEEEGQEGRGGALDVRVVHLLRDPRAVAASRQRVRRALARDSAQLARSLLLPRRYNATTSSTSSTVAAAPAGGGGGGAGVGAGAAGAADLFAAAALGAADANFAGAGAAGADHFAGVDGDVAAARAAAAAAGGGNRHYARPAQQQRNVPYQNPPPPPPLSRVDFTGNLMEVLCRSSAQGVQQGILEPWLRHRYLLLRYEDFLTDPERSLSSLYTFAGLPPSPDASALLNALVEAPSPKGDGAQVRLPSRARPRPAFAVSPRDANVSLSGWRRTLSAERVRVVQALCREVMNVAGYPLSCPASRGNFLWI